LEKKQAICRENITIFIIFPITELLIIFNHEGEKDARKNPEGWQEPICVYLVFLLTRDYMESTDFCSEFPAFVRMVRG
jgi:hypothetical protein